MDSDGSKRAADLHILLSETPSLSFNDNSAPEWSPDGQKIVFDSNRDGILEIYVMDADGSNVQRLTHNDEIDSRPAWSPDGQRIVLNSRRDGSAAEIYVMDADGGNVERLTFNDHLDAHADW